MVVVYSPTSTSEEATCDEFYSNLEGVLSEIPNREITMVIGDWNAKIGSTIDDDHLRNTVGKYGLGTRNDRGTRLLEFCIDKKLTIMNTCFQHHPRRLYTWTSPGDRCRNQIDYILISSRWRSSITNVKTFPGADCGSDHCLLVAKFALRLKAIKKKCLKPMCKLTPAEQKQFQCALDAAIGQTAPPAGADSDEQWRHLKDQINETFEKVSNKRPLTPCPKQTWMSDKTWKLIEDRKTLRSRGLSDPADRVKYSELSRTIQRQCRHDKNNFVERICEEVEEHAFRSQSSDLFKKVKMLIKQFKPRSWLVEDEDGTPLQDLEAVTRRWRNYCENLYRNSLECSSPQDTTNWC